MEFTVILFLLLFIPAIVFKVCVWKYVKENYGKKNKVTRRMGIFLGICVIMEVIVLIVLI